MKFILFVGLFVFAILANSFADDEHKNHEDHDDNSHACAQPKYALESGKVACFADIERWYHDHASGECKKLSYDGCNKNANNFESKEECQKTCDEWHKEHAGHLHHGKSHEHEDCNHEHDHAHNHH